MYNFLKHTKFSKYEVTNDILYLEISIDKVQILNEIIINQIIKILQCKKVIFQIELQSD